MLDLLQGNSMIRRAFAATFLFASLASAAGASGEAPAWRRVDAATGTIADIPGLEQLARDFPDSASVRRRLLNAYLEADMKDAALREAVALVKDGYAFSPNAREVLLSLGPSSEQKAELSRQDANAAPAGFEQPDCDDPARIRARRERMARSAFG